MSINEILLVLVDTEKVESDCSGYHFVLIATDPHVPAGSQKGLRHLSEAFLLAGKLKSKADLKMFLLLSDTCSNSQRQLVDQHESF